MEIGIMQHEHLGKQKVTGNLLVFFRAHSTQWRICLHSLTQNLYLSNLLFIYPRYDSLYCYHQILIIAVTPKIQFLSFFHTYGLHFTTKSQLSR